MIGEPEVVAFLRGSASVAFVKRQVARWLELKRDAHPENLATIPADADHSSLLERLLTGGPVFLDPPPVSFSYPWVDLDLGLVQELLPTEVTARRPSVRHPTLTHSLRPDEVWEPGDRVVINQARWELTAYEVHGDRIVYRLRWPGRREAEYRLTVFRTDPPRFWLRRDEPASQVRR